MARASPSGAGHTGGPPTEEREGTCLLQICPESGAGTGPPRCMQPHTARDHGPTEQVQAAVQSRERMRAPMLAGMARMMTRPISHMARSSAPVTQAAGQTAKTTLPTCMSSCTSPGSRSGRPPKASPICQKGMCTCARPAGIYLHLRLRQCPWHRRPRGHQPGLHHPLPGSQTGRSLTVAVWPMALQHVCRATGEGGPPPHPLLRCGSQKISYRSALNHASKPFESDLLMSC